MLEPFCLTAPVGYIYTASDLHDLKIAAQSIYGIFERGRFQWVHGLT